jgi:hypothetical protein
MKKKHRRLKLDQELLRTLTLHELAPLHGGYQGTYPCETDDCHCPDPMKTSSSVG